jgi:hypothetical protein
MTSAVVPSVADSAAQLNSMLYAGRMATESSLMGEELGDVWEETQE